MPCRIVDLPLLNQFVLFLALSGTEGPDEAVVCQAVRPQAWAQFECGFSKSWAVPRKWNVQKRNKGKDNVIFKRFFLRKDNTH